MSLGCELELLNLQNQQLLPEAFRTVLLQRPKLQIVVRPWWMDIPSGSSRMTARRAAPRLFAPAQPEGNCSRQSISCCTFTSACRSDNWHSTCRSCGLAGVSATANCQTPTLGHKSGRRDFPRLLCAARDRRPGIRCGPRAFAECCSLKSSWGQSWDRGQQCPCTRGTLRQVCLRELPHTNHHHL